MSASVESSSAYFYLSSDAVYHLRNFQYKGIDHSPIYKYILSPIAGYIVDNVVPTWLAPNAITLSGLVFMILAYFLTIFYYSTGVMSSLSMYHSIVPQWVFAINAIAMLTYQTLDNMDGKQARKTHSSSALGLLFDHGCDAINNAFGSQMWLAAMAIDVTTHPFATFMCIFSPLTLFYVSTWEEYHCGMLILPFVNGPTEGLLLAVLIMMLSFLYGSVEFWHGTSWWDLYIHPLLQHVPMLSNLSIVSSFSSTSWSNIHIIMCASVFWGLREILTKIIQVSYKHGIHTLSNLFPFASLLFLSILMGTYHPTLIARNFTLCLHINSFLFADMVTAMMLDHMTKKKYNPFRILIVPLWYLAGILVYTSHSKSKDTNFPTESSSSILSFLFHWKDSQLDSFLWMYAGIVFISMSYKIRFLVWEICDALGIYCFDIVTLHPRRVQELERREQEERNKMMVGSSGLPSSSALLYDAIYNGHSSNRDRKKLA